MSSGERSPSPQRPPQRQRPALTVNVSEGPSSTGRMTQLLENPTPRTRRVSKLPLAEACTCLAAWAHAQTQAAVTLPVLEPRACACLQRRYAFHAACRCLEDALQTRDDPGWVHADHFRADGCVSGGLWCCFLAQQGAVEREWLMDKLKQAQGAAEGPVPERCAPHGQAPR